MAEDSNSLTTVDTPTGTQMTINSKIQQVYTTTNGQNLYDKTLTGSKKVLFPTCVDVNACFDYRFSFKDLMLANKLPEVTDMYFQNLTVKIQDLFTQITSDGAIKNGLLYTYDPYSAVICQDGNGLEFEEHTLTFKGKGENKKFINSTRVIQRGDNSLYVVSSNLKIEKHINLQIATGSYKVLKMYNLYDEQGKFASKQLESDTKATVSDLRDCMNGLEKLKAEDLKGRRFCTDIILCDVLIFMLKSFNHSGIPLSKLTPENVNNAVVKRSIPIGWLTPEEKLEKYGKKGVFKDTFDENHQVPNNLFVYVDMQTRCDKIFSVARPDSSVFKDELGIVGPFYGQYAVVSELISVGIKSDN